MGDEKCPESGTLKELFKMATENALFNKEVIERWEKRDERSMEIQDRFLTTIERVTGGIPVNTFMIVVGFMCMVFGTALFGMKFLDRIPGRELIGTAMGQTQGGEHK